MSAIISQSGGGTVLCIDTGLDYNDVMKDTWGHLAPEKGKTYPALILFVRSAWGDALTLDSHFGADLEMSPWLFEKMWAYVWLWLDDHGSAFEPGVWLFDGTYTHGRKQPFKGTVRQMIGDQYLNNLFESRQK